MSDNMKPHPWRQPKPSDGPLRCAVCGEPLLHANHKVQDYAPKEKPPAEAEG